MCKQAILYIFIQPCVITTLRTYTATVGFLKHPLGMGKICLSTVSIKCVVFLMDNNYLIKYIWWSNLLLLKIWPMFYSPQYHITSYWNNSQPQMYCKLFYVRTPSCTVKRYKVVYGIYLQTNLDCSLGSRDVSQIKRLAVTTWYMYVG